jgi:Holliday junction resolvase RusA-like endonuclease
MKMASGARPASLQAESCGKAHVAPACQIIRFFVPGLPRPGGSKRAFVNKATGRVVVTEDCKRSKDWRTAVAFKASEAIKSPFAGPVEVRFEFLMPRPKGHFGSGKNAGVLRSSAPAYPAVKPDVTKLIRSTEDAMKGIAWNDDAQAVKQFGEKRYAEISGAIITIIALDEAAAARERATDAHAKNGLPFTSILA